MNAIILFLGLGAAEIFSVLLSFGVFILIFLALRAFFLWYWKVDTIIQNQEKQIDLLSKLVDERGAASAYSDPNNVQDKAKRYDEMNKRQE